MGIPPRVARRLRADGRQMRALPIIALIPTLAGPAMPQEVTRHRAPGSEAPISQAVEVAGGVTMVHLSGVVPPLRRTGLGDTRLQTEAALQAIEGTLRRLDLSLGHIVRMQAFLVGDAALGGRMDFEGFMAAYRKFFGTPTQPNLPARSVIQVAGLANPEWLVEIEVSAARPRR
jgi:enamine deaminase RidA (YjgF/YER057c/UK114 family)